VELLLAMQHRLAAEVRSVNPGATPIVFELFTSSATVLPTHNTRVQHRFLALLKRRNVTVHCNARIDQVSAQGVHQSGPEHSAAKRWTAADAFFGSPKPAAALGSKARAWRVTPKALSA
jgi:NADH dehydrogenase FAD-containing subunit